MAPDGRAITGGHDSIIRVWDLGRPSAPPVCLEKEHTSDIKFLTFAPDGRLLSTGLDGLVCLWDLGKPTARPLVLPGHDDDMTAGAFALAPDGHFFMGSADKAVRFWDLKNPSAPPTVLRGNRSGLRDIVLAPDGQLVTSNADGLVLVWDLKDLEAQPLVLTVSKCFMTGPVLGTTLDGRVVTTGDDGKVKVWEVRLDRLIEEANRIASRNLTYSEWRQFMGKIPYRRTFPHLEDGEGVDEARRAASSTK
jgi:WD40 repeat protein